MDATHLNEEEQNSPLADRVYGEVLSQIISGVLEVGAKLPSENDYCRMFSVSRPIVRVALSRLCADGIVERKRGSGTYIKRRPSRRLSDFASPGDLAVLLQCIEYRIEVEGIAAGLAAERRSERQLEDIRAAFDRLSTEAVSDFITPASDLAFHKAIAAATGNLFFIDTLNMLHEPVVRLLNVSLGLTRTSNPQRIQQVCEEHTEIFEAIQAGDPVLASAAMRMHLARSRRRITDHTQDS
ncbi:DNA-binding transcriptional regulator, FadR family [Celeribacter baekdonensis]|jgi:GntR family transcriptional repressor for pyruvate dehydrogenase complex|uniref:DNA-binding transcriptional regulator, FadR family n=1 Tax=Celeribacter baekdonensis TaxID=875171 RepID=A0A1G7S2L4_9RHOB|nr:FadR/GntR family transcriptional regulator [Celeribacter baekdonensis]MBU1279129.1 FadR family transcriptional regulator [Alphaproteobacteria bacterium]MBU1572860.1 FadR family transcriptional regulator [Alphaproteobacteria bacterium]MBU2077342.1 FadR family transcriptional regulator [Alphaproteobacteria bacterium]MBU2161640.1 FadR family transcriptional regulator [Alphaproteobacteria bacterium]MBU2244466.1 FadR family transcriptional regulator [Alphaproteobacteria bacterium]